jgi:hypothetical protein
MYAHVSLMRDSRFSRRRRFKSRSCRLWHRAVMRQDTKRFGDHTAFRVKWRWRQHGPPNLVSYSTIRGCIQKFPDWVVTKYTLTTINTRWEATQRVMAAKLTRLTHKIAIQLHLVAENCTICSSRSRRPVRKLLDTPSNYVIIQNTATWITVFLSTDRPKVNQSWTQIICNVYSTAMTLSRVSGHRKSCFSCVIPDEVKLRLPAQVVAQKQVTILSRAPNFTWPVSVWLFNIYSASMRSKATATETILFLVMKPYRSRTHSL